MQLFGEPNFLWLLFLGLPAAALYLFRRKAKRVEVSTMAFFKSLAWEHQESAWLRRLKKWISFLLTAALIAGAALALARPVSGLAGKGNFRTCVVLLDRSASMSVKNSAAGLSRFDEAKQRIRDRLLSLSNEAGVALVAYDNRPDIIQPRTLIRREFLSRLDETRVRPIAGNLSAPMESAIMLAGLETPALILHAADFGNAAEPEVPLPAGISLEKIDVALKAPVNVGITAFQVRKTPLEQDSYDVFTQVSLNRAAESPQETSLELLVGGVPSQVRNFELVPGQRQSFEFRVRGAGGQLLRLHVKAQMDAFPLDDEVVTPLPVERPLVAVWIRHHTDAAPQDAYTRLALSSIQESGALQLLAGTPAQWPLGEKVDAVIFDGWLPQQWPSEIPAVVINPPQSSGPILARPLLPPVPYDQVRAGNEDHPVLFRVASGRVAVTQTALFQPAASFEPLWLAGREPVLAAGEIEGQRIVVMAFSPQLSERLPLTASFPLLLGNALLWVTAETEESHGKVRNYRCGDFVRVTGKTLTWTAWHNGVARKRELPLASPMIELDQSGIWQTDTGDQGTAHLLSFTESDLPGLKNESGQKDGTAAISPEAQTPQGYRVGWVKFILFVILIILLLESWLFHRHAVY